MAKDHMRPHDADDDANHGWEARHVAMQLVAGSGVLAAAGAVGGTPVGTAVAPATASRVVGSPYLLPSLLFHSWGVLRHVQRIASGTCRRYGGRQAGGR